MKKTKIITLGTLLLTGLSVTTAQAENNVVDVNSFEMTDLSSGYMQLAEADEATTKKKEGACGEGKCGSNKKETPKTGEGKCGSDKKTGEGKCGSDKKEVEEAPKS
ncbi:MAG: hypothetical protein Q9M50_13785 [Methylococcales bacterium]|nr:hypothetical protein [Methylococcales bacterium]